MTFFKSTNFWLGIIFILFSAFIVMQSYLHPDGYLTSDSAHYLQMAKNLLAGNGMTTVNFVSDMNTYFATWPIGYPALIAGLSFLTGLEVFWASKLVNIICFGFCLELIKRLFSGRAIVAAMVFFVSTFTTVYLYTWSEVPFFLGMIWLVYGLVNFIRLNQLRYGVHLLLAALFMFFMRYIGLIGAGIIGLVGFYYLFRKQWKNMIICWIAGSVPILFAGLYLLINYLKTGLITGMERIPRAESAYEFLIMLRQGLIAEINMLATSSQVYVVESMIVLLVGVVIFIRPRHVKALFTLDRDDFLLPGMFLFVGLVYFTAIVYMRWNAHFDPFNFRLLGPFTLMVWLFVSSWVGQVKRWRVLLYAVLGIALVMNIGYRSYTSFLSPSADYLETKQQVQEKYQAIPAGSIVAFESIHARYLRPDIQYVKVQFQPYFAEKESVQAFIERVTPNRAGGVFLESGPIRKDRYHQSFINIMEDAEDAFIRVKR